jgi:hypothetical protein
MPGWKFMLSEEVEVVEEVEEVKELIKIYD